MMKQNVTNTLLLLILICTIACTTKKEHHESDGEHSTSTGKWEGMDEFHMVMAESFHPFKDSANLEPAKANAAAMAAAAKKWRSAQLPEKMDSEEIKSKLQQLELDASGFVSTIETGDDTKIGESLTELHDLFHELQEAWYQDGQDEQGDHDEHEH